MSGTRSDELNRSLIIYSFSHTNAYDIEFFKELGLFERYLRKKKKIGKDI